MELEPGVYEVIPKLTAQRYSQRLKVEDVVELYADTKPQKLRQVGVSFDLAHAKAGVPDTADGADEWSDVSEEDEDSSQTEEEDENEEAEDAEDSPDMGSTAGESGAPGDAKDQPGDELEKTDRNIDGSGAGSKSSWNAVCVIGLRVYAKDSEVSITLADPKDPEEAASLTVDEKTPAGATM